MDSSLAFSPLVRAPVQWRERALSSYVGRAFVHPLHMLAVGSLVAASLWAASVVPALAGVPVLEALVLGVVPHWRSFRGRVDTERERRARAERERRRLELLGRMSVEHRDHVVRLERLLASLRARLGDDEQRVAARINVEDLIDRYAALAVLHEEALHGLYESPVALASLRAPSTSDESRDAGDGHGCDVVSGANDPDAPLVADTITHRRVSAQRVTLMQRRLAARRENEQRLAAVGEQLETIAELVKLVHERSLFAVDIADTEALIEQAAQELELSGNLIDHLLTSRSVA
jgi:hypothetical protein